MNDDARQQAEAFVREVETALVGLPHHRRVDLTAGLVDHLLEPGDDGRRLIDDHPDPASYAAELQAMAPARGDTRPRRRVPYVAGAALVAVVLAGVWIGAAHPWTGPSAPAPTVNTPSFPAPIPVPDVRGLSEADAISALTSAGFSVSILMAQESESNPLPTYLPSGTVLDTDPFPGALFDKGSEVVIMLNP